MFQPLIIIYRRDIFEYDHWECISIYSHCFYPFRSLDITIILHISGYDFNTLKKRKDIIKILLNEKKNILKIEP